MIGSQLPAAAQTGDGMRETITPPPPAATPALTHRGYLELESAPRAVPYARRYTRRTLATWKLSQLTDDAELVVSDSLNLSVCSPGLFCCFSGRGSRGFRGRLWRLGGG
jgi:hypothetical protein